MLTPPALKPELHQWFTPRWVCEAIVERYFRHLGPRDLALEPACGDGRFIAALPDNVPAVGVEIDPDLADLARRLTGRRIITGDFLDVQLPGRVSCIIGNPPYHSATIHAFLRRAHEVLTDEGLCGLLLPAYVFQTSSQVLALNRQWSIEQELVPRNLFPNLKLPLIFARFRKDPARTLVGFLLYRETADVIELPSDVRAALNLPGTGSVWRRAVRTAFARLGASGPVSLEALYGAVERPTANSFWRQQVRKVLQAYPEFCREASGLWRLATEPV